MLTLVTLMQGMVAKKIGLMMVVARIKNAVRSAMIFQFFKAGILDEELTVPRSE